MDARDHKQILMLARMPPPSRKSMNMLPRRATRFSCFDIRNVRLLDAIERCMISRRHLIRVEICQVEQRSQCDLDFTAWAAVRFDATAITNRARECGIRVFIRPNGRCFALSVLQICTCDDSGRMGCTSCHSVASTPTSRVPITL
jgi:hypothetical protein